MLISQQGISSCLNVFVLLTELSSIISSLGLDVPEFFFKEQKFWFEGFTWLSERWLVWVQMLLEKLWIF